MSSILRQLAGKARCAAALGPMRKLMNSLETSGFPPAAQQLTTLLSFRSFNSSFPSLADSLAASPLPPWTPTRELQKRKTLPKRMGHMLQVLEQEKEAEAAERLARPNFGPGDFLELTLSVPENKRRTTVFKGICIARRNRGWRTSFTLRNFIGNSGGIERSFPLYSPHLLEVKVLNTTGRKRYRRAKLYFLRDRQPKEYRVQ